MLELTKLFIGILLFSSVFARAASKSTQDFQLFSILYSLNGKSDDVLDRYSKMEALRVPAQGSLERLMKKSPGNVELELRYAELIVQRGRDLEQFSLELSAQGNQAKSKELKKLSLALLRKGLEAHSRLLIRAQNHPMAPKIYLGMARTEYSLGQKESALRNAELGLASLARSKSNNLGDTELQLYLVKGDSSFDLSKGAVALAAYNAAIKRIAKDSIEEAYVNYKLAWVHYNLRDPVTSLLHIDEVFKVGRDRYALRQEAALDFALFLADSPKAELKRRGGLGSIYEYLSKNSASDIPGKAFERLAGTLAKNGKRDDAIAVNEFLIKKFPSSEINIDRALAIVEWYHSLADKKFLSDRYHWLITEFGPKSSWYQAQGQKIQVQKLAQEKIESSVRKYATQLHSEAAKETVPELRNSREAIVAKLYDAHILAFNGISDVPNVEASRIHYYRAEIHRRQKEWAQAGARYDDYLRALVLVPKIQQQKIDSKLSDEALLGSVEVWANAVDKNPSHSASFITAADRFLLQRPRDPKAPQVLLDAALIEHKNNHNSVALARLEKLVKDYPQTPQCLIGVNSILDILNKELDWVNLARKARIFSNTLNVWAPAAARAKQQAQLTLILSQTELKACETLRQTPEQHLEAALCFASFAKGFSRDTEAPKALLISSEIYEEIKDPSGALQSLEILVKNYPTNTHAIAGFSRLARVHEQAFEFGKAVGVYENLLEKNGHIENREKILARLVQLLFGLGQETTLTRWLAKKTTPQSLRNEIAARQLTRELADMRSEENQFGLNSKGIASVRGQNLFQTLETKSKQGKADLQVSLELRRIRGLVAFQSGQLDKADGEWQSALKEFWKSKDKTPELWESAARIFLQQASIWEVAFKNTNVVKNPARKAELFKKLEKWYADVVEMKSPTVALDALWKSSQINNAFADDFRNSPMPGELLGKGLESQRETYTRLVLEKTEPMKKKAVQILERIAEKARDWKVVSPTILASVKLVGDIRKGVSLPGRVIDLGSARTVEFPWAALPRWAVMGPEYQTWEEWALNDKALAAHLAQSDRRSESRRAAFVSLFRSGSLKNPSVAKWAQTFTDRPGIQLRIQAYLADGENEKATLFLDQYENFYSTDSFSEYHWGQLEWNLGHYTNAHSKWVRPALSKSAQDFRSVYWSEGWGHIFDEIAESSKNDGKRSALFAALKAKAAKPWEKIYLAKLCIESKTLCEQDYSPLIIADWFGVETNPEYSFEFADGKSTWTAQREMASTFVASHVSFAENDTDIVNLRKALSRMYLLQNFSSDSKDLMREYWGLRKQVDSRQEFLDARSKNKIIVGA